MAEVHSERYGVSDDEADIERVRLAMLSEARDPGFAMLSPTSIATVGAQASRPIRRPQ